MTLLASCYFIFQRRKQAVTRRQNREVIARALGADWGPGSSICRNMTTEEPCDLWPLNQPLCAQLTRL